MDFFFLRKAEAAGRGKRGVERKVQLSVVCCLTNHKSPKMLVVAKAEPQLGRREGSLS